MAHSQNGVRSFHVCSISGHPPAKDEQEVLDLVAALLVDETDDEDEEELDGDYEDDIE